MDELFEALTLIQTGKVPPAPIILVGSEYWHGLVDWLADQMLPNGMIAAHDLDLFTVEDDPRKVVRRVVEFHAQLRPGADYAPSLPGGGRRFRRIEQPSGLTTRRVSRTRRRQEPKQDQSRVRAARPAAELRR